MYSINIYTPGVRAAAAGMLFTRQMNDHTTRILTRVKTDATAKSEAKLYSELAHGTLPLGRTGSALWGRSHSERLRETGVSREQCHSDSAAAGRHFRPREQTVRQSGIGPACRTSATAPAGARNLRNARARFVQTIHNLQILTCSVDTRYGRSRATTLRYRRWDGRQGACGGSVRRGWRGRRERRPISRSHYLHTIDSLVYHFIIIMKW